MRKGILNCGSNGNSGSKRGSNRKNSKRRGRSYKRGGSGRFNYNTLRGVNSKYRGSTNRFNKLLTRSIRFPKFNRSPSTTFGGIIIIIIIINEYDFRIRSVLLRLRKNKSLFIIALLLINRASISSIIFIKRVIKGLVWWDNLVVFYNPFRATRAIVVGLGTFPGRYDRSGRGGTRYKSYIV